MKHLIFIAFIFFMMVACSGPSSTDTSTESDTESQTDCSKDSDCLEGYACSSSGSCVLESDNSPTPPFDCTAATISGSVLHVATDGSDVNGDGSESAPYASITTALDNAEDGATILVNPGLYEGRVRIRGTFSTGVTVRSKTAYRARLRNDGPVITGYTHENGCRGITIEGFDIAHSGEGAGALVVHLDGGGTGAVSHITLRNNILHDSYNNDILKINNGISNITVDRNLFYNQTGSDEHIDINSAANVLVQDNIFMNDFSGSGRVNGNDTGAYIVIKDSNGDEDRYTGSRNIHVRRNIFLNWEGSTGSNFLLLGEDGQDFYEAYDITIENNLMLGNSSHVMRAPFGVKGGRGVYFRNNTIAGDLPAMAYAMRINQEGSNPVNDDIFFYNNIWSDPTGTMGADGSGSSNDFSDTPVGELDGYDILNNLYWNGGAAIPTDSGETVNADDDVQAFTGNAYFGDQAALVPPRWNANTARFEDGSATICEAFIYIAETYGTPYAGTIPIDRADGDQVPHDDLLGNERGSFPDIGAVEVQ